MCAFTVHDCFKVCSREPLVNKCICRFIYYENYQEKDQIIIMYIIICKHRPGMLKFQYFPGLTLMMPNLNQRTVPRIEIVFKMEI